jgi:RES domain protein
VDGELFGWGVKMIFCDECFKDEQIKSIIVGATLNDHRSKGNCPICGKKNVFLYNTDKDSKLNDFFYELINIYTPQDLLPSDYPSNDVHMIADELKNEWNIFSDELKTSDIYNIIKTLSPKIYSETPNYFISPVGVPEKYDQEYLKIHSILRGHSWEEFVESIKHDNRFHTQLINTDKLETYLSYLRKDYEKGKSMYRGRLCYSDKEYEPKEMGAPPIEFAKEGRANSTGIRRLYLADSEKTCIHEIRSGAFDSICIGKFSLCKDISVIDFKRISKFSPFNGDFDFLEYLVNKPILNKIDKEMGRALRAGDNHLDYIPTQYLCDFIKTLTYKSDEKYSGVEYSSTLNPGGNNLAIFYPDLFKCTNVKKYTVNSLKYDFS